MSFDKNSVLPINVKKVINDITRVKINIKIIKMCLFMKLSIN